MAHEAERLEYVFPQRLASLRREAGLSQAELADRIDVSKEFVSRMERGKALPAINTFVNLVQALRCSADELLNETERSETADAYRFMKRLLVAPSDARSRAMFVAESVLEFEASEQNESTKRSSDR